MPADLLDLVPAGVRRLIGNSGVRVARDVQLLDFCAGKARITRWAEAAGIRAIAIDRAYAAHLDATSDEGLATVLLALFRVERGGLAFMAPQCSTWVQMSRGSTGRSPTNVLGKLSSKVVSESKG